MLRWARGGRVRRRRNARRWLKFGGSTSRFSKDLVVFLTRTLRNQLGPVSSFVTRSPVQPVSGTLIARGVLEEVKLMVVFGIEPPSSLDDLGGDLRAMRVEVFLLHFLSHSLGDILLSGRVVEDRRAVLWR